MSIGPRDGIRVIKAGDDLAWEDVPRPGGRHEPTGTGGGGLSFRRLPLQHRLLAARARRGADGAAYHEIALTLEGEVEVTSEDGTVLRVGPGDLLITPKGTTATWNALSPVRKLWAVSKE